MWIGKWDKNKNNYKKACSRIRGIMESSIDNNDQ